MAEIEQLPSTSKWVNDNFILGDLLGSGTFGRVYTVQCRRNRALYALKEICQTSMPKYIAQELKIMINFGGRCNVMGLYAAFRDNGRVFVVMEHFPHDNFKDILPVMCSAEKLLYIKNLFIALEYLHTQNIIHRDVKPANFLYNRNHKKFALIDFGLSHDYITTNAGTLKTQKRRTILQNSNPPPQKMRRYVCGCSDFNKCDSCLRKPEKHVNKAGTPGFRAPEVLLRFDQSTQSPAMDIWSAGVILLSMLLKRHPVFRPADDVDNICEICAVLGTDVVVKAAQNAGVRARLPHYPGIDIGRFMRVVRSGVSTPLQVEILDCPVCCKYINGNSKGRCFCKRMEIETLASLDPYDRCLIGLLKMSLNPDLGSRKSATTLLLHIEDFEEEEFD